MTRSPLPPGKSCTALMTRGSRKVTRKCDSNAAVHWHHFVFCNSSSAHVSSTLSSVFPASPRSVQAETRLVRHFLLFRLKVLRMTCCGEENERNGERERGRFGDRQEREGADRRADRTGPTAGPWSAEQRRAPAALRMCHFQVDGTAFHEMAHFPADS